MSYRLTEICLPLFNINGQMRKAVKAKLVDLFLMDETVLMMLLTYSSLIWDICGG